MHPHRRLVSLTLFAALSACTAAQHESPNPGPVGEPTPTIPAEVTDPMASSARMVGGEWRLTFLSGTSMYTTCHWGPGKHSLRSMTHGFEASGDPWRDLGVAYWHPGRKQLRILGWSPWKKGVSEGEVTVDGEASVAVIDQFETGAHRKLISRSVFDGPDKYHSALFEVVGAGDPSPLAEWDIVRYSTLTPIRPLTAQEAGKPSEHLKPLESLLGHSWVTTGEAKGERAAGANFQCTFEWIPLADAIYVCVLAHGKEREPEHLLDAYVFHHTGTGALRCLALSNRGGVYEGDVIALDGGALQFELQGYEGDQVVPHVVRFDFEKDGTLRDRVWYLRGAERTLMLDVYLKQHEPERN